MIRIPDEIDRYIMDGKIQFALEKQYKVGAIELNELSLNNDRKKEYYQTKKNNTSKFDNILTEEIKKISSK